MGGVGSANRFVPAFFRHLLSDGFFSEFEGIVGVQADDSVIFYIHEGRTAVDSRDAKIGIEA